MPDLVAYNTQTFVASFDVTAYAQIYPLAEGVIRMQMRVAPDDLNVIHEWATDAGNMVYGPVPAVGSVTYTANPAVGDTLTLGTATITFVASGATGLQVAVGASLAATLASLLQLLSASANAQIALCTYRVNGGTLAVTFKTPGATGDTFALAASSSGAAVSSATLTGGGAGLVASALETDVQGYLGAYSYDVRHEVGTTDARLFGGAITFLQGVTR